MNEKLTKFKDWIQRYERHLTSFALLSGFVVDAITLRRIDQLYENLVFISYFVLLGISMIILNNLEVKENSSPFVQKVKQVIPFVIQFAFGGLFSGFTIFYFRSGSFVASWPFIIILIALLLGNEVLKRQYARLVFQATVFFIALFFFTIFFIPVLINMMGPLIFVLSGLVSLLVISLFIQLLFYFVPERVNKSKKFLAYSIGTAFILINILYFTNVIPPIPLSLKDAGVYHSLVREGTGYRAQEEKRSFLSTLQFFDNYHVVENESIYVYSAIFAPTNIRTEIIHDWQRFDEEKNRWVTVSRIPYTIVGGTDRGYRGYTTKRNVEEGEWRVDVETPQGQVIGRILFEIFHASERPNLEEKIL